MPPKLKDLKQFLFNFKLKKDEENPYNIVPELQQLYEEKILPELTERLKLLFKNKKWQ